MNITEFNDAVSTDRMTLVDFYAGWCGPCKVAGPEIDKLAVDPFIAGKVSVIKIDVDSDGADEITAVCGIRNIPAALVYKSGKIIHRITPPEMRDIRAIIMREIEVEA